MANKPAKSALPYILVRNKLKNCEGFFPRTVPGLNYNREDFLDRLAEGGAFKRSLFEGMLSEMESTIEHILSSGGTINLAGFLKIRPRIKGSFDSYSEPFNRSKHSIEVEATVSKKFSKKVALKTYVERVDGSPPGATITTLSSERGIKELCPYYINTIAGSGLMPKDYSLTGLSLESAGSTQKRWQLDIPLESLNIAKMSAKSISFFFRREFVWPDYVRRDRGFLLSLNYYNSELDLPNRTNSFYVRFAHSEGE